MLIRRFPFIILSTFTLMACGAEEGSSPSRSLPANTTANNTTTNQWQNQAASYDLMLFTASQCDNNNEHCGGYYFFSERQATAKQVRAKIRATLDNGPWTANQLPIPTNLSFVCRFQVCTQSETICTNNSTRRDSDEVFWQSGGESRITLNQPEHHEDFEITHTIPANSSLRIHCNYHWKLHEPTGTPPRIIELGSRAP